MNMQYDVSESDLKDFTWLAKSTMPSTYDRTKNDPCFLLSSKKSFELISNLAEQLVSPQVPDDKVIYGSSDIFSNEALNKYILKVVRSVAMEVGWSDVKQYNGQYIFISDLLILPKEPKTIIKTMVINPADLIKSSLLLLGSDEDGRVVAGVILEAMTIDRPLEVRKDTDNPRVSKICDGLITIGGHNHETGNLIFSPGVNELVILTIEFIFPS